MAIVRTRRAAEQHVKHFLRGTSSWLHEGLGGSSPPSSSPSSSARQVLRPVFTGPSSPAPFNASYVLPRGGLRHAFGFPETFATSMRQQLRGAKISGSEVQILSAFGCLPYSIAPAGMPSLQHCACWHASTPPIGEGWLRHRAESVYGAEPRDIFVLLNRKAGRIEKVLKTQHTTQGRGGAIIQVELRDVKTGLKSSARLRTSEAIEKVFVDERYFTFLYKEEETVYLMHPMTFEQVEVPVSYFERGAVYLTGGMEVTVQYFDGEPLSVSVPPRVTCTVADAEPYFKGQTATPSYKKVVLENGQQIMTPSFITAGDVIVVDTTDDSYVTRSKT